MQSFVNGLDRLLCMHAGRRRNHHRLQRGLRAQHLVVVQVRPGTLEVLLSPFQLVWPGRRHRNDLRTRREVVEMQGMASAHTAEAGDGDLELGHCN